MRRSAFRLLRRMSGLSRGSPSTELENICVIQLQLLPESMPDKARKVALRVLQAMALGPVAENLALDLVAARVAAKVCLADSVSEVEAREAILAVVGAVRRVEDHERGLEDVVIGSTNAVIWIDEDSYCKIA